MKREVHSGYGQAYPFEDLSRLRPYSAPGAPPLEDSGSVSLLYECARVQLAQEARELGPELGLPGRRKVRRIMHTLRGP